MSVLVTGVLVWSFDNGGEVILMGISVRSLYSKKKDDGMMLYTAFMSLL